MLRAIREFFDANLAPSDKAAGRKHTLELATATLLAEVMRLEGVAPAEREAVLAAVRSRQQPSCTPEEGHLSTTAVKLAMISYDTGAKIAWDAKTEQITGNPEAAKLLKRAYRAPWVHPSHG